MSNPRAMAIGAHPDDVEFVMSGTLMLLAQAGYEIHVMSLANGCCGSVVTDAETTASIRTQESADAAKLIGATYHLPITNDLEILYEQPLIRKLCAIIREVQPEILLIPSPQDYMEDHTNTARLAVTAAFCRNMPNYVCDPVTPTTSQDICLYHAMPMGLMDPLRQPLTPELYVDVHSVMQQKRDMLACHKSQKEWLDESQGHDNYIHLMGQMCQEVGKRSGRFGVAEGWRRHLHLGFGSEDFDPISAALTNKVYRHGGNQ